MKEFADFVRKSNNSDFAPTPTWNDAVSLVGSIPSAQPQRKKGKWVWNQYDKPHIGNYHCSVCRNIAIEKYTYCPNCGADMRG